MTDRPLEACSVCGDMVPGGEHDCWARKKMNESIRLQCRLCGHYTINGICLNINCFEQ